MQVMCLWCVRGLICSFVVAIGVVVGVDVAVVVVVVVVVGGLLLVLLLLLLLLLLLTLLLLLLLLPPWSIQDVWCR